MTESELRTQSDKYNAATAVTMGYQEIYNSAANWQTIMDAFEIGQAKDLNEEPKKLLKPVVLTGSGPSLDDSIEKLRLWQGAIVCHYSQALTLMHYDIEPDYIVALDAICNWEGLQGVPWEKTKTKLVLHAGMWPSLVKNWPNEMLFYRQNMGKPDSFGMSEQKIMYSDRPGTLEDALATRVKFIPKIKTELTMFACTPPAQLFVAQVLQYGNVFLSGMDFAYHGRKERFTNWIVTDEGWKSEEHILPEREYVKTNNGLDTDPLHLYYKKNMISACRLSGQQIYTTDKGAITEMPYISIDDLISGKKLPKIDPETRKKTYDRYLASISCFAIDYEKGSSFVEVKDPERDLTGFMMMRNRSYGCKSCGAEMNASDDIDHTGDKCPQCQNGKITRINPVDIESNMKRIRKAIEFNKVAK